MKKKMSISALCLLLVISIYGCGAIAKPLIDASFDAMGFPDEQSNNQKVILILSGPNNKSEEHCIGINTIKVHEVLWEGRHGYFFIAYDHNEKYLNYLFYESSIKEDAEAMNKYFAMNQNEKKQYIYEVFLKYANVDLGPIESEEVGAVTEAKSDSSL